MINRADLEGLREMSDEDFAAGEAARREMGMAISAYILCLVLLGLALAGAYSQIRHQSEARAAAEAKAHPIPR
jgi:hypothetical protein